MSDKQAYEIQLTENIQRKSMNPIEEAQAYQKYVNEFLNPITFEIIL